MRVRRGKRWSYIRLSHKERDVLERIVDRGLADLPAESLSLGERRSMSYWRGNPLRTSEMPSSP